MKGKEAFPASGGDAFRNSGVFARQSKIQNPKSKILEALWEQHDAEWRDPHQIASQWQCASEVDPRILEHRERGRFWEALAGTGQTLIVTREYEHLVMALQAGGGHRRVSYLHLPHPNGLAVDADRNILHIASTRNPNMIFDFAPCRGELGQAQTAALSPFSNVLLPLRCRYLPGCTYLHDMAMIGGRLHANAVSMNAVVELPDSGGFKPVWWPRCIDGAGKPLFGRNYLQLNSIAAGSSLERSYFSASAAQPSARRPGHLNFPVDKRGVVFSGKTREVIATGLTRPHSARLLGNTVWLDNSGYGEVGRIVDGRFEAVARLPGWTRGLCFGGSAAFAGSSRVIPRFRHYAPGLDCEASEAGIHAVDLKSGRILGSLVWPLGNQIFALGMTGSLKTPGFPFVVGKQNRRQVQQIFFRGMC